MDELVDGWTRATALAFFSLTNWRPELDFLAVLAMGSDYHNLH